MQEIKNIGIHHFAGQPSNPFASTKNMKLEQVDIAHRARWPDFKSSLGYFVGYNLILFPDGKFTQTRLIGEETAAATGSNFNTFHICLAGNFTLREGFPVDFVTEAQKTTLKTILNAALSGREALKSIGIKSTMSSNLNFAISRIYPHRVLQPNHTECFGNSLPDDWARRLIMATPSPTPAPSPEVEKLQLSLLSLLKLYVMQLQDILAKRKYGKMVLGHSNDRSCEGVL